VNAIVKEKVMSRRFPNTLTLAVLVLALPLAACKKAETAAPPAAVEATVPPAAPAAPSVRVTDVQLGKSLGPDKKVQSPTETFAPKDTIFAAVITDGSGPAVTIGAKWTFQDGQTVKEDSRSITPNGSAITEFSIQKPGGWPKGSYKVDITVNGQAATSKSFRVE
jgi:hypothetical protein